MAWDGRYFFFSGKRFVEEDLKQSNDNCTTGKIAFSNKVESGVSNMFDKEEKSFFTCAGMVEVV